jgi:hypothetical protein
MDKSAVIDYRARLLEQLLKSADAFCAACRAAKNPRKPLDENGWSVHQLAQHVRDVDLQSYSMRARRTLLEQYPSFPKFDADAWASQHYDAGESLEKILTEFDHNVHALVEQLKTQPDSAWSRLGRHEIQGDRTLQIWVERSLEHIQEHLETVESNRYALMGEK